MFSLRFDFLYSLIVNTNILEVTIFVIKLKFEQAPGSDQKQFLVNFGQCVLTSMLQWLLKQPPFVSYRSDQDLSHFGVLRARYVQPLVFTCCPYGEKQCMMQSMVFRFCCCLCSQKRFIIAYCIYVKASSSTVLSRTL